MAYLETYRPQPWLESPLLTPAGGVQLAGALHDNPGIDPAAMRVLGSYALVYMVSAQGYYADARGVRRELVTGDLAMIFPELAHAYGPNPGTSWRHLYFVMSGALMTMPVLSAALAAPMFFSALAMSLASKAARLYSAASTWEGLSTPAAMAAAIAPVAPAPFSKVLRNASIRVTPMIVDSPAVS